MLVRISAEGSGEVNVLPQFGSSDITSYEFWGDSSAETRKLATFDPVTITEASVALISGTWDFSLKTFKLGNLILLGDLEDKAISTSSNSLAFVLSFN